MQPVVTSRDSITIDRAPLLGGIDLIRARFVARTTPLHSHPELEIGLVVSGRRLVKCRGAEYLAPAGSILVFNPGEVHSGAPLDALGSTYRAFLLSRESLESCHSWARGPSAQGPWFASPVVRDDDLWSRFTMAHGATLGGECGHALETRLLDAVGALSERHSSRLPRGLPASEAHRATIPVRAYLEEHFARRVRLDTLADLSGVSVFYLIRIFRAATGLSPYAYLEQIRVHRAAQMLRDGLGVSRVAFLTGFSDQSHLTRLFKRLTGVPPGEYQRSALRSPSTFMAGSFKRRPRIGSRM